MTVESKSPHTVVGVSVNPPTKRPSVSRGAWIFAAGVVATAALVWIANRVLVTLPVSSALHEDSRNAGYEINAHYKYYVVPHTLVLDLSKAPAASPIDLFRGLFQSAAALHGRGRRFETVILANHRKSVFQLRGQDFDEVGDQFEAGENPMYLLRTFPEKMFMPDGSRAFGSWEGGIIGVLNEQMRDVNAAANAWVEGIPPTPRR